MNVSKTGGLALVAMSWIAAVPVHAHEGMHGPGSQYDTDHSGALSVAEYGEYLKETGQDVSQAAGRFAAIDTNKDGELSSGEFARGRELESKP